MWNGFLAFSFCLFGAITPFTERTQTDFDTVLKALAPAGQWKEVDKGGWFFCIKPAENYIPMTEGKWIYTDWGWLLQSSESHAWATSHYGAWMRLADGTWGWRPDADWRAHTVEFRETKTHIGWRPSRLDRTGAPLEKEEDIVTHPEEWLFLSRDKFALDFKRKDLVTGEEARPLLAESVPCEHLYVGWREQQRTGPDPVPMTGRLKIPNADLFPAEVLPTPAGDAKVVVKLTKVDFYTVMSLPSADAAVPVSRKPAEVYLYRPKFFQDNDGIKRRIKVWNDPAARKEAIDKVNQTLQPTPAGK